MKVDFDTVTSRRGTDCVKWDLPAGEGVLPLWVADMDFPAAPEIVEALRRRVDEGVFGYALPPAAWHESLARWLARRHGWRVDPDSVLNAISVLPALAAVIRVFCQPGDKVVLQTPAYNGFLSVIRNQGCEISGSPLRRIPPRGANGDFTYEMDYEDLERRVSDPRAKLFLLCNPHNPAGRVWTTDEMRKAGEICLRHGVFMASDEIHADLQMPGSRHTPFATVSEAFPSASATFWSASKAFNLAGLQTAAVICGNPSIRTKIRQALAMNGTGDLNPFGFLAAATAWDRCEGWLDDLRRYLYGNDRFLATFIRERLPRVQVATLEATYLAWADFSAFGLSSAELANRLEREAKVKCSPGAIYAEPAGSAFLRINLATSRAILREALTRIAETLEG